MRRFAALSFLAVVKRSPVVSSMMAGIGYDPAAQILEIEFRTGGTYQYFDVPADAYDALQAASSKGRFFHAHIDGCFRYRRVDR